MPPPLHQQLWQDNGDLAKACLDHPFVQGLADGTLGDEAFRRYIAQDAFFLAAFARGYAMCAASCDDIEDFRLFYELQGGVLEELKVHAGFAAELNIDLKSVEPFPETRNYTAFLLETGTNRSLGETVAAMTPCMRLYAYLGSSIAAGGIPDHQYRDWIEAYSSPDFEALASSLEESLDRFVEDEAAAAGAYKRAMECELDFFSAPLRAG